MNRGRMTRDEIEAVGRASWETLDNLPMAAPVVTIRTPETDLMGRALHRVMCGREWRLPLLSDFAECLARMTP